MIHKLCFTTRSVVRKTFSSTSSLQELASKVWPDVDLLASTTSVGSSFCFHDIYWGKHVHVSEWDRDTFSFFSYVLHIFILFILVIIVFCVIIWQCFPTSWVITYLQPTAAVLYLWSCQYNTGMYWSTIIKWKYLTEVPQSWVNVLSYFPPLKSTGEGPVCMIKISLT